MRALFSAKIRLLVIGSALSAGGCAEVQMQYNVLTYDNAIADTANQLLLLNAVRASQRYPKSFTNVGAIQAGPPVSGSLPSSFNFASVAGLTTYGFTPSVSASAGYGQFALENANSKDVMEKLRGKIPQNIIDSFYERTNWPRELLDMVYVQALHPSAAQVQAVDAARKHVCAHPRREEEREHCQAINDKIQEFTQFCTQHFSDVNIRMWEFQQDPKMYYNTAVNYCHYTRFQLFAREARLLGRMCTKALPGCVPATYRSALQMIDYLGELIAAQNYREQTFEPKVLYGHSTERRGPVFIEVPFFVVHRGATAEKAAVIVWHDGIAYYIPQPDFGSPYEARSLQTLDLVLQTVRAATLQNQKEVPKVSTIVAVK